MSMASAAPPKHSSRLTPKPSTTILAVIVPLPKPSRGAGAPERPDGGSCVPTRSGASGALSSAFSGHQVTPTFLTVGMAPFAITDQEGLIRADLLTAEVTGR